MTPEKKKNILDQAIDLFSNRDEKAAAEEAKLKEAAAKEAAGRAAAEKAAADKAAADAQLKAKEMEAKSAAAYEANKKAVEATNEANKKLQEAQKAAEVLATHTVVAGETLSDISMKYYKSSIRDKWIKIYEANKDIIGDNPSIIKAGQVLKIPKL